MKTRTLATFAVVAPLAITGSTLAAFTGITTVSKPNEFGIKVCNVYAVFDEPGDLFLAAAGTPDHPMDISVIEGTFFQHTPFSSDRAPQDELVGLSPSLAYDTFVTIGVKMVDPEGDSGGQPQDEAVLNAGWPGFGPSTLGGTRVAWAVTPDSPQADPFNPDFVDGTGQVLIGQFSTMDGIGIEGEMLILVRSDGANQQIVVHFQHVFAAPCPWDCADGNGVVNISDFLAVLAQWGQVGSSCDFDGGGVSITDFLDLLAHKGPCP